MLALVPARIVPRFTVGEPSRGCANSGASSRTRRSRSIRDQGRQHFVDRAASEVRRRAMAGAAAGFEGDPDAALVRMNDRAAGRFTDHREREFPPMICSDMPRSILSGFLADQTCKRDIRAEFAEAVCPNSSSAARNAAIVPLVSLAPVRKPGRRGCRRRRDQSSCFQFRQCRCEERAGRGACRSPVCQSVRTHSAAPEECPRTRAAPRFQAGNRQSTGRCGPLPHPGMPARRRDSRSECGPATEGFRQLGTRNLFDFDRTRSDGNSQSTGPARHGKVRATTRRTFARLRARGLLAGILTIVQLW